MKLGQRTGPRPYMLIYPANSGIYQGGKFNFKKFAKSLTISINVL